MTSTRKQATSFSMQTFSIQAVPIQTVLIQLLLAGVCALALTLIGWDQALAALLAGACVCLPGFFVARQFVRQAPTAPKDEALIGEGKTIGAAMAGLIGTFVLMGLVFAFMKPPALGFFSTLAITQVAPLLAATLQDRRRAKSRRQRQDGAVNSETR